MDINENKTPVQTLTPDEALVKDFIETRLKKVLADIQDLADTKSTDEMAWSANFTYLAKTYGKDSDETFKWFKYYLRENMIPEEIKLPLLAQIYMDATVDKGFVGVLSRTMKNQPEDVKQARVAEIMEELKTDENGRITLYRGYFEKPFGTEEDASRPIEKAFAFSVDPEAAKRYAIGWFPQKAVIYTVKVLPEDIAWYSLYDEDKTVLVLPQSKGGSLQVAEAKDVEPGEYADMEMLKHARDVYMHEFRK